MSKKRHKSSDGRTITFQADDTTLAALEKLKAVVEPGNLRPQSAIIRNAILAAAARL